MLKLDTIKKILAKTTHIFVVLAQFEEGELCEDQDKIDELRFTDTPIGYYALPEDIDDPDPDKWDYSPYLIAKYDFANDHIRLAVTIDPATVEELQLAAPELGVLRSMTVSFKRTEQLRKFMWDGPFASEELLTQARYVEVLVDDVVERYGDIDDFVPESEPISGLAGALRTLKDLVTEMPPPKCLHLSAANFEADVQQAAIYLTEETFRVVVIDRQLSVGCSLMIPFIMVMVGDVSQGLDACSVLDFSKPYYIFGEWVPKPGGPLGITIEGKKSAVRDLNDVPDRKLFDRVCAVLPELAARIYLQLTTNNDSYNRN